MSNLLPREVIEQTFQHHARLVSQMEAVFPEIEIAADIVTRCLKRGGRILLCGNGGSAADAEHIACELVGRFYLERPGLPAIALTSSVTSLTAIGNDYGFETIFSRQVVAHGRPGDVLIGLSTSGNSANVLAAAEIARQNGLEVIGLTGSSGGHLKALSQVCLCVPSDQTPRIQEMHITIGHILCQIAEAGNA